MHSEEVVKLNVALKYCDQLKNNLQASILHVQMLNRKYNTTYDYNIQTLSKSIIGSPRKSNSPQQETAEPSQMKKKQVRSVKDIKQNFNSIIVNGIKLQREVETTTTQLKLLRKEHQVESPFIIKRRLQSVNHTPVKSPSGCRHGRCFQSPSTSIGSRNKSAVASVTNHSDSTSSVIQTPQRKRTRRLAINKVDGTPVSNGKKLRFQSTPIKFNEPTSSNTTTNGSCFLNSTGIYNSSCSIPNTPLSMVDDELDITINSPINRSSGNRSNASQRGLNDTPKRICWTPIVKVKKISIYQ